MTAAAETLQQLRDAVSDAGLTHDVPGMQEPAAVPVVTALALVSIAETLAAIERHLRGVK